MVEQWRPVTGFEGLYEVSDEGRVRSCDRVLPDGRHFKSHVLTPWKGSKGYLLVSLPGARKIRVNRLVAETFVPNPENLPLALHCDGDKHNNRAWNLRWGTNSDNMRDAIQHGTYRNLQREKTHCKRNHALTGDNIYLLHGKYRVCKACRKLTMKAYRERRKNGAV